jgi:hypothetical protein
MTARVHRLLKVIAFNANGMWRQPYELSKQLQDLHIDVALFSETHLKPHERFFILYYHFYLTDCFLGRKGIAHNHVRPVLFVQYIHLKKAKPIHKRQTHTLVIEDVM